MPDKNDNTFDHFPSIGALIVSKMIVDENVLPGFMYREKRMGPEDSGWRIFAGLETDEYIDDPANMNFYAPATILKIDPSLETLLLKGIGSVYERIADDAPWNKITDFQLDDDYLVTHKLTENWTIGINNLFERKVEKDGDLLYTTGDKSVRIAIWNDDRTKPEIYAEYKLIARDRDQTLSKTLEAFDFSDDVVARPGFLIREDDGSKSYGVIYGWTIADQQMVQAAFYFDDDEDKHWAIETWKNIKLKE